MTVANFTPFLSTLVSRRHLRPYITPEDTGHKLHCILFLHCSCRQEASRAASCTCHYLPLFSTRILHPLDCSSSPLPEASLQRPSVLLRLRTRNCTYPRLAPMLFVSTVTDRAYQVKKALVEVSMVAAGVAGSTLDWGFETVHLLPHWPPLPQ